MPRPSRPLTRAERTKPCPLCGAQPGERCTNPDGSAYAPGEHVSRADGIAHKRFAAEPADPDHEYTVIACRHCAHPGGQHILAGGCKLCRDCPGWDEGGEVRWTDRMTRDLEAAMAAGPAGEAASPAPDGKMTG